MVRNRQDRSVAGCTRTPARCFFDYARSARAQECEIISDACGSGKVSLKLVKSVKGGGKVDHQGGAKPDHFGMVQGVDLCDLQGWLERRPAPPLGGAFRPERKAPL